MKKAKFALTAVAVLAVVGGALAFKASRGNTIPVYVQDAGKSQCTFKTDLNNRTTAVIGDAITTHFSLASTTVTCPLQTVYSLQ